MKKHIKKSFIFVFCLLIVFLVGCSSDKPEEVLGDNVANEQTNTQTEEYKDNATPPVKKETIETQWFTLDVPSSWSGRWNCEQMYDEVADEYRIYVNMTGDTENDDNALFCIHVASISSPEFIVEAILQDEIEPIGELTDTIGDRYFVLYEHIHNEMTPEGTLSSEINDCVSTFKAKSNMHFQTWNDVMFEEIKALIDTTPYVPYSIDILGRSLESYKNQSGGYCYEISSSYLDYYLLDKLDGITYYMIDDSIIGEENGFIVAMAFSPATDSRFGSWSTTPSVRDYINSAKCTELFNVTPELQSVDGASVFLYKWKANNGYILIKAVGSPNPTFLYDNTALAVMFISDKKLCSISASEMNGPQVSPTPETTTEPVEEPDKEVSQNQVTSEVPYIENISRADQRIYAGPGYDYECVRTFQQAGLYTIVEEAWDSEGNLWGKLKSGIGWVDLTDSRNTSKATIPVSANYAKDIALPAATIRYTVDDSGYSVEVAFMANETLTDISLSRLELGENGYEIIDTFYTLPELVSGNAFVPRVCFYGDFTMYCLSFTDANGNVRHFGVTQSGRNDELIITEEFF